MNEQKLNDVGQWFIVNVRKGDRYLVLRLRIDQPKREDIRTFTHAIAVKWPYPLLPGSGAPPKPLLERMQAFEESISELSFMNGNSYLMNVGTGEGVREWLYYANDRDLFMRRFNELLVGTVRYPLKIEFYDDPEWRAWHQFRGMYERSQSQPGNAG